MSQANLDLFLAEARKSQALSDQVRDARSHAELIKLAANSGHNLSKATVVRHHLHRLAGRSDSELESLGEHVFNDDFGDVFLGKFI
ncbi:Nif11-like leader peptide family natural product precursor [Synechococcus sp. UW140]|uniref:Nif11-like leader peptide family natural product precursor n=1 Tax=Synechococcus sp. UW140 TaxID=368503 RepID=UPI0025DD28DF|nr:Nif11-like leader peptide family natural product precursor [Synechococcus sp. UW140]